MFSQLARLKLSSNIFKFSVKRNFYEANYLPPLKKTLNQARASIEYMDNNAKHYFIGGERSLAVAIELLLEKKIIAVPTDTVYGLATLAQDKNCVDNLYELKERDKNKPIAICLSSISDIHNWAEIDHLPKNLLGALLPGSVTVVLKRKSILNSSLNPGTDTIGIRVTDSKFIRSICKVIKQPLALTSANLSNQPSSLVTNEFRQLWPNIGGIFYTIVNRKKINDSFRVGSTVVDLTEPMKFSIIRKGAGFERVVRNCYRHGVTSTEYTWNPKINNDEDDDDNNEENDNEDETVEGDEAVADKECEEMIAG